MGIPLWESPPKHLDKASASSRCNIVHPAAGPVGPRHSPWSVTHRPDVISGIDEQRRADWRAPGSFNGLSSRLDDQTAALPAVRRSRAPLSGNNAHGNDTSSMLTLDEFLRETSQASAASNEAERHLQALLAIRRRGDLGRPSPSFTSAPGPTVTAVAPPSPTAVAPADSFDTLVTQIRRIGALQDFMLSSVDATTTSLENSTTVNADGGNNNAGTGGESTVRATVERDVASLRIREARLRAMQTRIDLLANEFALLRNTRRELRRVEAEALETLQNSGHSPHPAGAVDATTLLPERRAVRRAFLQPEAGSASSNASTSNASTATVGPTSTSGASISTASGSTVGQRQAQTVHPSEQPQPQSQSQTVVPRSVDHRTSAMTERERDRLLREAMMQMSMESLPATAM